MGENYKLPMRYTRMSRMAINDKRQIILLKSFAL